MKPRVLGPVLILVPLVALPFVYAHFQQSRTAGLTPVEARIIEVQPAPCLTTSRIRTPRCWSITLEYRDRGNHRQTLTQHLQNPLVAPLAGDRRPLLLRPDGTATQPPRWSTFGAVVMLALLGAFALAGIWLRRRAAAGID